MADEIDAKGRYWTSAVVDSTLRREFTGEDQHVAAVLLSRLVGEDPGGDPEVADIATCRLMLAALKVSERDLAKLAMWIEVAHNDPRDLIAAAEYRRQLQSKGDDAPAADHAEYVAWLALAEPPAGE